jgi:hypothetical protein
MLNRCHVQAVQFSIQQEAIAMDKRLDAPWTLLRYGIGLTATLAGLDKFFYLLADWSSYVSPLTEQLLPFSTGTFMGIVGVIEFAVGVMILAGLTRLGAYIASGWLLAVAVNLVLAGFYDVAVRDVVMAFAAFTLARLAEVRQEAPAYGYSSIAEGRSGHVTA